MLRFIALLLTGMISFQAFYNVGVLGYWMANRNYIAANICENRARPQLHCDGKCYLRKKLAAAGNPVSSDGSQLPVLKKGLELAVCPDPGVMLVISTSLTELRCGVPAGECYYAAGFPQHIFHPPAPRA